MRFRFAMAVSDLGVCPATYKRKVIVSPFLARAFVAGRRVGFFATFLAGLLISLSPISSWWPFGWRWLSGWRPFAAGSVLKHDSARFRAARSFPVRAAQPSSQRAAW